VSIATNAANGTVTVPVSFEVVAKGAPLISYQGVVNNATFAAGEDIAPGDIVAIFGEQFTFTTDQGSAPPLKTAIGGAAVLVNGNPAPMYYALYGQLAFQMPVDAPLGTNVIQVRRDDLTSNPVTVNVVPRAPRLLVNLATGYGIIQKADYSVVTPDNPAKPGDTLVIYAIGLGLTSPSVATGAAAPASEPLARLATTPQVSFGASISSRTVLPAFAGLTPGFAGLYQLNVVVPEDAPKGVVPVTVNFPDAGSNVVWIQVQ
jgi:uncharacterized protein (TIGR03437 family)